jgi:L-ascorbate metabolism protein UlaG (beta-lactamase superfamily)
MNTSASGLVITYVGGPTALLELGGLRFLTDPTFDPAGTQYPTKLYRLRKLEGPALSADKLGYLDAVLLSHDHHFDNLDHTGREMLNKAERVLTTPAGASRLGGRSIPLAEWQMVEFPCPDGRTLQITGIPAQHGPSNADRGPVTGFLLSLASAPKDCIYISGDTVWHEGLVELARRFDISVALLFMGAAVVREVGPAHLTMTAAEGVIAARRFGKATIVPLHYAGWEHFTESREEIARAFVEAGLQARLRWLDPGVPTLLRSTNP